IGNRASSSQPVLVTRPKLEVHPSISDQTARAQAANTTTRMIFCAGLCAGGGIGLAAAAARVALRSEVSASSFIVLAPIDGLAFVLKRNDEEGIGVPGHVQ